MDVILKIMWTIIYLFIFCQGEVKVQIPIPVKEYIPAHTFHLCVDRFIKKDQHFGKIQTKNDTEMRLLPFICPLFV